MISEKDLNLLKEADDERKIEIAFFMINEGKLKKDEILSILDIKDDKNKERLTRYDRYMRGKLETMLKKVSHHLFIRNYVNDLASKRSGFSKNFAKKILSRYIVIILSRTCILTRKDILSNHLMEVCFHTIEDELKDEFREFMYKSLVPSQSADEEKAYREYFQKYITLYASYILKLLENDDQELDKIKEKLKNLEITEVECSYKIKEKKRGFVLENANDTLYYNQQAPYNYKMKKVYKEYFQYDQDHYKEDYYEHMKNITSILHEQNAKMEISHCVYNYLTDLFCEYYRIFPSAEDRNEIEVTTKQFIMSFYALLAYHLIHCDNDPDFHKSKTIVSQYEEIKNAYKECQKSFYMIYEELKDKSNDQFYMSIDIYDMSTVLSVLLEIDRVVIARKVKKIIYEDETLKRKRDINNFSEINKYHFQLIKENKISFDLLHDLASEFVLGYIKDKVFIAGNLAFVHYAMNYMKERMIVYVKNYDQYLVEQCKKNDELIKYYDELVDEMLNDQSLIDELLSPLYISTKVIQEDYRYYMQINDLKELLERYRNDIIYSVNKRENFLSIDKRDQMRFIIDLCIYLCFIDSMKRTNQYILSVNEIKDRKNEKQLKEEVEKLKNKLKITQKDLEIKQKNQQLNQMKLKREINKEYEKNLWGYQKEISNLKKTIAKKEKEVKNNFQELCKLRELIFSQQVESNEEDEKSVDLNLIMKDKSIIILGGHYQLREKLKKKYPQLRFMGNGVAINDFVLANADYVFIFYHFLDHVTYYQVMKILRENPHVEWDYIPYTNLQKTENTIYNKILKAENK